MQILILPMLAHSFQNGQSWEVVDPSIVKIIVDKLLDPPEEVNYTPQHLDTWQVFFFSFMRVMGSFLHVSRSVLNMMSL
jgi:hypothetical protein